jgi:hypothetical protein
MLHRPQIPMPHFIRISRLEMIRSGGNPNSVRTGRVNLIMIGGPQMMA